jgi:hypothetical protein
MRLLVSLMLIALTGCTYLDAQSRLTEQVQKGVQLVRQSQQERLQIATQCYKLQRQRLDDAFDADVHQRANLSADWVIEARTAYAAALDALYRQQQASQSADAATSRNLDVIDQALQRLAAIQSVQLRLLKLDTNP